MPHPADKSTIVKASAEEAAHSAEQNGEWAGFPSQFTSACTVFHRFFGVFCGKHACAPISSPRVGIESNSMAHRSVTLFTMNDRIVTQWYELFLDLWNQRYRIEQQPREWLAELWKAFGGDPLAAEEPSVIVTALLLRVRADFVALDRATRALGQAGHDGALAQLRQEACRIHDRWAAVFRAERVSDSHGAGFALVTD